MAAINTQSPPLLRQCWQCKAFDKSTKLCARCHVAAYCSIQCQKADWIKNHKNMCPTLAEKQVKKRETLLNRQALENQELSEIWKTFRSSSKKFELLCESRASLESLLDKLFEERGVLRDDLTIEDEKRSDLLINLEDKKKSFLQEIEQIEQKQLALLNDYIKNLPEGNARSLVQKHYGKIVTMLQIQKTVDEAYDQENLKRILKPFFQDDFPQEDKLLLKNTLTNIIEKSGSPPQDLGKPQLCVPYIVNFLNLYQELQAWQVSLLNKLKAHIDTFTDLDYRKSAFQMLYQSQERYSKQSVKTSVRMREIEALIQKGDANLQNFTEFARLHNILMDLFTNMRTFYGIYFKDN